MSVQVFEGDGIDPRLISVTYFRVFETRGDGLKNYVVAYENRDGFHAFINFQVNHPQLKPILFDQETTTVILKRFQRSLGRSCLEIEPVTEERWSS